MDIKDLCRKNGIKLQDLAVKFWPESNEKAQRVNMSQLINKQRKSIRPEWVEILSREFKLTYKQASVILTNTKK